MEVATEQSRLMLEFNRSKMLTTKRKSKLLILQLIVISLFSYLLFTPTTTLAVEDFNTIANTTENTIIPKIKELNEKNAELEEELRALPKKTIQSNYGVSSVPEDIGRDQAIRKEIADNNALIKAYRDRLINNTTRMAGVENKTTEQEQKLQAIAVKTDELKAPGQEQITKCWTVGGGFHWGACVLNIFTFLFSLIIYLFGFFLWLAGALFDLSILISIKEVNWFFSLDAVSEAWRLMRDLANIFFIFILLYIAIGTIFDLSGIGSPQKMVVNVIIIALLVNFSGFFVRVVVDASNVIAYEFYLALSGEETTVKEKVGNLGSRFVGKIAPSTYLVSQKNKLGEESVKIQSTSVLGTIAQGFLSIILILVACFVLIVASIMFFIRTIVLLFIYIVSPFAFMSKIIPDNKFNYFKTWSDALIKQSLYAPGFLAPLLIVFTLLGENGLTGKTFSTITSVGGYWVGGTFNLLASNVLIMGLLISCIFIAQKFGAVGLGLATATGSKFTQGSSQIVGRYGGRIATNIGKRIPGNQALKNSWNEGRLSRVRQSWDTGVLRGMRDSQAGQVIGQGVKNPLFSAGAGIGFMAKQMGVKDMNNITGDKVFSKEVEERAGKYLEEMRKMETDNDRVRYLESLAGQGKREEFDAVYAKLSPEERRKLEQTSRRRGDAGNPRSQFLAQKLETSRKGLKLKAGQDTAIEMVKDLKLETNDDAQRVALIEHLSQDDLNAVYKGLSREEKVALERSATGNQELTTKLGIARDKLKAGDKRAVERGMTSENAYIELKGKLERGEQISEQDVTNLSKDRLLELSETDLTHIDVARHLTIGQLKAIRDSEIPNTTKKSIRLTIENLINTTNPNQMPDHLTKLAQYFNSAGAGFGD